MWFVCDVYVRTTQMLQLCTCKCACNAQWKYVHTCTGIGGHTLCNQAVKLVCWYIINHVHTLIQQTLADMTVLTKKLHCMYNYTYINVRMLVVLMCAYPPNYMWVYYLLNICTYMYTGDSN